MPADPGQFGWHELISIDVLIDFEGESEAFVRAIARYIESTADSDAVVVEAL
jgi:hypothetical protein